MALPWKLEDWAKAILEAQKPDNIPEQFQICHHDENERADSSRIVLTASETEEELAGPKAKKASLQIELFVTVRDAALVETIDAAIGAAFEAPVSAVMLEKSREYFTHLEITDQSTEKEGDKETRRRVRNLEILAKELLDA